MLSWLAARRHRGVLVDRRRRLGVAVLGRHARLGLPVEVQKRLCRPLLRRFGDPLLSAINLGLGKRLNLFALSGTSQWEATTLRAPA